MTTRKADILTPTGEAQTQGVTHLEYHTYDVFTSEPFGGNPLAVFPVADGLSSEQMQRIAQELNLSESVFVRTATDERALRELRIFTPAIELPFAGHPTIGAALLLIERGVAPIDEYGRGQFTLQEAAGLVQVEVDTRANGPALAWLTSPQLPERGPDTPSVADMAAVLSVHPEEIVVGTPAAYSAGVPFLYVRIRDRETLARVRVDVGQWQEVVSTFWAPHLYVFVADEHLREVSARMFAPAMGIPEDPATGAGAAGLAGYLWDREAQGGKWRIAQGIEMGRPSELHLEMNADGGSLQVVRVGGAAVHMGDGLLRRPA